MKYISILLLLSLASGPAICQTAPYQADVSSAESIVHALYEVISGPAEAKRDWARFRNLFVPESKLIPTGKNKEGNFTLRFITPEEYITLFSNNIKTGFYEKELHRETEAYGTIAHVFSTYETKEDIKGSVTNRGINSIQLYKDKDRYYIVNVFWCAESMGFPIPANYLN